MSNTPAEALRHLPQPMECPADDPFKHDAFGRKKLVEKLTPLVQSFAGQSFVLAINGVWGSGKSVFLNMWEASLKQQGFRTLRFNAWENDHSEDPFASVFAEFRNLAQDVETEKGDALTDLYQGAKKLAMPILAKATAGVIKHATMGLLNIDPDAESILGNLAEASAQHALDKAESGKKSIEAFRKELGEFVKRASTPDKPVVYFIDELDRCRPTYAISVLERVKHLLNVPGVVFVFAWDRNQLNETVKSVYGQQTDPSGYLFRFVDLEFNLPITSHEEFCKSLMSRFGLMDYGSNSETQELIHSIPYIFPDLAIHFNLSIRDQEKCFTALSVIMRTGRIAGSRLLESLIILIMLRIKKHPIYQAILKLPSDTKDPVKILCDLTERELPEALGKKYWQSDEAATFEGQLIHLLPENARSSLESIYPYLFQQQAQGVLTDRQNALMKAYQSSRFNYSRGGFLAHLIKQMEFSERFL